jgi:type III pantothenate kinase
MKLLLDVGNTRLKWGLFDAGHWLAQGAFAHDEAWTFDEVLPPVGQLAGALGVSVAGEAAVQRLVAALAPWSIDVTWMRPTAQAGGVTNGYAVSQLGADRWAALMGAWSVHPAATLVVTAGTATTIDVLRPDGYFAGGLIVPGVDLMKRSLAGNTAQLPLGDGVRVDLPTRTIDAIHMGCLHAQAGAIERMFAQIADMPDALVLLNGGAAPLIAPLLRLPCKLVDNLVLEGVAVAAADDFR